MNRRTAHCQNMATRNFNDQEVIWAWLRTGQEATGCCFLNSSFRWVGVSFNRCSAPASSRLPVFREAGASVMRKFILATIAWCVFILADSFRRVHFLSRHMIATTRCALIWPSGKLSPLSRERRSYKRVDLATNIQSPQFLEMEMQHICYWCWSKYISWLNFWINSRERDNLQNPHARVEHQKLYIFLPTAF